MGTIRTIFHRITWGYIVDLFVRVAAFPAKLLLLSNRHSFVRLGAWFSLILAPITVAMLNLPELASARVNLLALAPQLAPIEVDSTSAGLISAWLGFTSATFFNFGWSRNERVRLAIARGRSFQKLDELPNLLPLAVITAIAVLIAIPLAMYFTGVWSCSRGEATCAFAGPSDGFMPWLLYDVDLFVQLFPIWIFHDVLKWPNVSPIQPLGATAIDVEIVFRATFQALIVSTFIAAMAFMRSTRDAIFALTGGRLDPIKAIGRRALPYLYEAIREAQGDDDETGARPASIVQTFLKCAATAIGEIGDERSLPVLKNMACNDKGWSTPRRVAVDAMVGIVKNLQKSLRPVRFWNWYAMMRNSGIRNVFTDQNTWAKALLEKENALLVERPERSTKLLRESLGELVSATSMMNSEA